jgi:hypothetical protein
MDASIVAIGLIVLHAFATAVLWFELRSHEKESRERIDRATKLILDAISTLRSDLAPAPSGGSGPIPSGGAPASAGPSHARVMVLPSAPRSGGISLPFRPSLDQVARARAAHEETAPVEDVRATVEIPRELPPSEIEASPGDREIDATSVFSADDRTTAHPASPTLVSAGVVVPLTVRVDTELSTNDTARVEAYAAARGIDFETALYQLATTGIAVMREGPASERRLVASTTPPSGPANDAPPVARETASVPPPVEPPQDPRVKRRWYALIAQAQEAGEDARHCHGERCVLGGCACQCEGCALIAKLLIKAKRDRT